MAPLQSSVNFYGYKKILKGYVFTFFRIIWEERVEQWLKALGVSGCSLQLKVKIFYYIVEIS